MGAADFKRQRFWRRRIRRCSVTVRARRRGCKPCRRFGGDRVMRGDGEETRAEERCASAAVGLQCRHSQRTRTHPYERTHANPTPMSIFCLHHGKVVIVEHVLATLGIGGMGLLLVLVGPDSVAVLADNEFSAINMGVDDSEPDNEFSAINMGVNDSGGLDIFGFVPAWLDGIIVLIDDIASAAAA
uniref:Uncharacterized protein n=2 Tax=Oryza TaxID=4527 RepID=A0A0E0IRE0_ORYNI